VFAPFTNGTNGLAAWVGLAAEIFAGKQIGCGTFFQKKSFPQDDTYA
jgi:hypothetical protein